jgi:SAM-dependent methyltransferase
MTSKISENVMRVLACPNCSAALQKKDDCVMCSACGSRFSKTASGALDLRLTRERKVQYEVVLGREFTSGDMDFRALVEKDQPQVDFSNTEVPYHLTEELLSYFPKAASETSLMLDLGCGNTIHRSVCEHAGFEYVGLDYEGDEAPILGDAHSLPFLDEIFEFVLSIAVLEHVRFPTLMMKEAYRVLKPGGTFIGTVAFLEPFHGNSFYHHTHLGTYNSLVEAGFEVSKICPSQKWDVLTAQSEMALFPKMPGLLARLIVLPVKLLHRLWWKVGGLVNEKATEEIRIRDMTGAFTFIATKKSS